MCRHALVLSWWFAHVSNLFQMFQIVSNVPNCFKRFNGSTNARPGRRHKLFSRQWRKKMVTSGSFALSCGLSWHNATIFLKN